MKGDALLVLWAVGITLAAWLANRRNRRLAREVARLEADLAAIRDGACPQCAGRGFGPGAAKATAAPCATCAGTGRR